MTTASIALPLLLMVASIAILDDPLLAVIWAAVTVVAVTRAVIRRTSVGASYTYSDAPPGQNRTDRAVNGCINWAATAGLIVVFIVAIIETVGVW